MIDNYPETSPENCSHMSEDQTRLFISCCISEVQNEEMRKAYIMKEGDEPLPFLASIVLKRIEVLKLPISFTLPALIAINALAPNPGKAVVLLVDCLNHFEGSLITTALLADLYPSGYYNEKTFISIVDDFMKPKRHKWSEIY